MDADFIPSLKDLINRLFDSPDYRPMTRHELEARLHLGVSGRTELRRLLREMEKAGTAVLLRKNRWARPVPDSGTAIVRIQMRRRGTAFARLEDSSEEVVLETEDLRGAIHGDRALVSVDRRRGVLRRGYRGDGPGGVFSGRVVRVLERRFDVIPGLFRQTPYYAYVIPEDPRLPQNIRVTGLRPSLVPRENQLVAVRLDPWTPNDASLHGIVEEIIGDPDAPHADMKALMLLHGLVDDFPDEAQQEAQNCRTEPEPADLEGRRDLRNTRTLTIDPEDARDFDDAVSLDPAPNNGWRLGVHIADVSHFVKPGGAIDREAEHRATSVYLVDRAIPMLPGRMTAEVCSLLPGRDRLCHSVFLDLDAEGRVIAHETVPSVIRSQARLTYDQVQAMIEGHSDGGIPPDLSPTLRSMDALARILRRARMAAGALEFTVPEVKFSFDADGRVESVQRRGGDDAYHLIEEFMLLANQAVARTLSQKRVPAIYRIHEEPDDRQWTRMEESLLLLGLRLRERNRPELNRLVRATADGPVGYAVALSILRNLKRAEYSPRCVPHFGLAFHPYTHFTSPIRRYPDLLVHRMLKAVEKEKKPPYSFDRISVLAQQCSLREQEADEAERESVDMKRIAYYVRRLREGDTGPLPGVVVDEIPKGYVIELRDSLQRGLLARHGLRGRTLSLGTVLAVDLVHVDEYRRRVDFGLSKPSSVPPGDFPSRRARSSPRRSSKKSRRHKRR